MTSLSKLGERLKRAEEYMEEGREKHDQAKALHREADECLARARILLDSVKRNVDNAR